MEHRYSNGDDGRYANVVFSCPYANTADMIEGNSATTANAAAAYDTEEDIYIYKITEDPIHHYTIHIHRKYA